MRVLSAAAVLAILCHAGCKRMPHMPGAVAIDTAVPAAVAPGGCGNGKLDAAESCDDGNRINDDGCTSACVRCDSTIGDARVAADDGSCLSRLNAPRPWLASHRVCAEMGGHLAAFANHGKQRTVEHALLKGDSARFWIGQRLYPPDLNPSWITGEALTAESWHAEGKNTPGSDRDCVAMSPAGTTTPDGLHYLWSLEDCANERPFICEVPPWRKSPGGTGSYRAVYRLLPWQEAQDACKALGAHLATITGADERAFVVDNFRRAAWIGATDEDRPGAFHWVTGEPYLFEDFAAHEPDNRDTRPQCVLLGGDQHWHDRLCTDRNIALCETD